MSNFTSFQVWCTKMDALYGGLVDWVSADQVFGYAIVVLRRERWRDGNPRMGDFADTPTFHTALSVQRAEQREYASALAVEAVSQLVCDGWVEIGECQGPFVAWGGDLSERLRRLRSSIASMSFQDPLLYEFWLNITAEGEKVIRRQVCELTAREALVRGTRGPVAGLGLSYLLRQGPMDPWDGDTDYHEAEADADGCPETGSFVAERLKRARREDAWWLENEREVLGRAADVAELLVGRGYARVGNLQSGEFVPWEGTAVDLADRLRGEIEAADLSNMDGELFWLENTALGTSEISEWSNVAFALRYSLNASIEF